MPVLQFPSVGAPLLNSGRVAGRDVTGNVEVILEPANIDLDDDEIRQLIDAVYHYEAYMHSQHRDATKFRELLMRLRNMLARKRPE